MTLLLVDVGNTRTKVAAAGSPPRVLLRDPGHDCAAWPDLLSGVERPWRWAVAGVHPARVAALVAWAAGRGERCDVVGHFSHVPVEIRGPIPDQVGIDRLLDCCAANARRTPDTPAVVIDCGTAIVVNVIDPDGAFVGGAILPGVRAMLAALHHATAALPMVEMAAAAGGPAFPATNTADALRAGCFAAAAGGMRTLIDAVTNDTGDHVEVFLTGGDGHRFERELSLFEPVEVIETLTLEGLQLAAEGLP